MISNNSTQTNDDRATLLALCEPIPWNPSTVTDRLMLLHSAHDQGILLWMFPRIPKHPLDTKTAVKAIERLERYLTTVVAARSR